MVQHLVRIGIVVTTLIAGWRVAEAACGTHWIGTPSGATIPRGGSLYVFDDQLNNGRNPQWQLYASDGNVQWTAVIVGEHVVRLDYTATGTHLTVTATGRDAAPATARYEVARDWQPPASRPAVARYQHERSTIWDDCSYDYLGLEVKGDAAAFRVKWRQADQEIERVVPARRRDVMDRGVMRTGTFLDLGQIELGVSTLDARPLYKGGALAVWAILHDGTQVPVAGVPDWVRMRDDDFTPRALYTSGSLVAPPAPPPAAAATTTDDDNDGYPWPRWTGAVIAVLALALGRSARRRRKLTLA